MSRKCWLQDVYIYTTYTPSTYRTCILYSSTVLQKYVCMERIVRIVRMYRTSLFGIVQFVLYITKQYSTRHCCTNNWTIVLYSTPLNFTHNFSELLREISLSISKSLITPHNYWYEKIVRFYPYQHKLIALTLFEQTLITKHFLLLQSNTQFQNSINFNMKTNKETKEDFLGKLYLFIYFS